MPGVDRGDLDPLDICVLSERPISRAEVVVGAQVVGGIPMVDDGQADDKIIGILRDHPPFGALQAFEDVPEALVGRLIHYFWTYKPRDESSPEVRVGKPYNRAMLRLLCPRRWRTIERSSARGIPRDPSVPMPVHLRPLLQQLVQQPSQPTT
jgi:hypothetical protein